VYGLRRLGGRCIDSAIYWHHKWLAYSGDVGMVLDFIAKLGAMVVVAVIFIMAFPLLIWLIFFGENKHD